MLINTNSLLFNHVNTGMLFSLYSIFVSHYHIFTSALFSRVHSAPLAVPSLNGGGGNGGDGGGVVLIRCCPEQFSAYLKIYRLHLIPATFFPLLILCHPRPSLAMPFEHLAQEIGYTCRF